jgi:hypothetical protein
MEITVKNVLTVNTTYAWAEDVQVKMYNESKVYLHRVKTDGTEEVLIVDKTVFNSITLQNKTTSLYGDYIKQFFGNLTQLGLSENENVVLDLRLQNKTLSLKYDYFEINQTINEALNGVKTVTQTVFKFPENTRTNAQLVSQFYPVADTNVWSLKITLFDINQLWYAIKTLCKQKLSIKVQTKIMIRQLINKFMLTNLYDYCDVNSIEIIDSNNPTVQNYIKLKVVDNDRNVVIWNLEGTNKVTQINRYPGFYLPFMNLFNNEKEFQLLKYSQYNSLFNLYDVNYGGIGISGTGLWSEVKGNLTSTLFCKENDIKVTIDYSDSFNIVDVLKTVFTVDDCIITNNNEDYISKINQNVNTYIIEEYIKYLLTNFYSIDSILNQDSSKVSYSVNNKNVYQIDMTTSTTIKKLTIILTRK